MNSSESASTETEQKQREQRERQTVSQSTTPVSAPETNPGEKRSAPGLAIAGDETFSLPNPGELSFSCLLIPRFHDHYLTGDITEYLVEWMRQVCISYGWRLDAIAVRPGYLQWVMIVPLNANPAQFMRIIRQHTSQRIFDDFPRFRQHNMSGQFWAPGDFVVSGSQLQTPEAINNYIVQTRRHQGIA